VRRGRDSNPRYPCSRYGGLANRWFQPLTHLSGLKNEHLASAAKPHPRYSTIRVPGASFVPPNSGNAVSYVALETGSIPAPSICSSLAPVSYSPGSGRRTDAYSRTTGNSEIRSVVAPYGTSVPSSTGASVWAGLHGSGPATALYCCPCGMRRAFATIQARAYRSFRDNPASCLVFDAEREDEAAGVKGQAVVPQALRRPPGSPRAIRPPIPGSLVPGPVRLRILVDLPHQRTKTIRRRVAGPAIFDNTSVSSQGISIFT
jgi:hypothetical protein